MEIKFMQRAIELAKESMTFDEVPIGAVVVKDGRIISEGQNFKERKNNAICHAEIVALSIATEKVGNWWLEGCEVYVTLEPCAMCMGAMINSRISKLYFGAFDEKTGACGSKLNLLDAGLNHTVEVVGGILAEECGQLLTAFFFDKRNKKKCQKT